MSPLFDDLREHRQEWREWLEGFRWREQYRRDEWPGWTEGGAQRGVIETDIADD